MQNQKSKTVFVDGDCMDWRNNAMLDRKVMEGHKLVRTAGGNADNVLPTLKRHVSGARAGGSNVVITFRMHTECGEKGYCFEALKSGKADGIVGERIVGRYKGMAVTQKEDMCKAGVALTETVLRGAFAKEIAEGTVEIVVGLTDTNALNMPMEKKEKRLMITKTLEGVTYEQIGKKLGFGAYAYYLHADSVNEILADAILAHRELGLVQITFVAFSAPEFEELKGWMRTLKERPEAHAAEISLEKAY